MKILILAVVTVVVMGIWYLMNNGGKNWEDN